MSIERVAKKYKIDEQPKDISFWKTRSYEARIDALERIREEYHRWRYDAKPRLQRFYRIVKRK